MPLSQLIPPQMCGLAVVLALILSQNFTFPSVANSAARNSDSRDATVEADFFAPVAEIFASLAQAISTVPLKNISISPEIVAGEASCPRSAEGEGVDCTVAALSVCARAGFHTGFQLNTATRWVCRGSGMIAGADGADCKSKTSTTRALCW